MRISLFLFLVAIFSANMARAEETCDPKGRIYPACSDQKVLLTDELAKAKKDHKMLLLVFGADWCPWCQSLHQMLKVAELPEAAEYNIAEIALYDGQEKSPSGLAVLDRVLAFAKKKEAGSGIPLMALVNPVNEKAAFIETESLEKNTKVTKGHDPKKLFAALTKAKKKLE
ncbi:MAG: thioredoxin family protein [Bdellovibrionota bacterium]